MRRFSLSLLGSVVIFSILIGCSPKIVPTPTPAPTLAASAPAAIPAVAPSPQDTAWAKVVQDAKKEGTVNILNTIFLGDVGVAVTKAFKYSTGIQVEFIVGRGGTNYERIKTEKRTGQMVTDVIQASSTYHAMMNTEGLLAGVADLPVFRDKNAWLLDPLEKEPNGKIIPFHRTWMTPYVNTKLVKQQDWPTSLQDLLKPQWKGKMVLSDPRTGSGTYKYYVPLIRAGGINWEYIKALGKQDLLLQPNNAGAIAQVAQGAVSLTPINNSATLGPMVLEGAPIKALSMNEGDIFDFSSLSPISGNPHPNATRVFINWFMGEEGQRVFVNIAKAESLRKNIPNLVPEDIRPPNPNVRKIGILAEDEEEAEKLFRNGYMADLLGLKR